MNTRNILVLVVTALAVTAIGREGLARPRYEVEVLINGVPTREYSHHGRKYVMGREGDRYSLRVRNNTRRRIEVLASVDGLDVIDGQKADFVRKRGYVLGPWQSYEIEGFRLNMSNVAAFRFSSVADSYAAARGDARNVGVIGVAIFPEKKTRRPRPRPVKPRGGYGRGQDRDKSATAEASPSRGSLGGAASGRSLRHKGPRSEAPSDSRPGLGTEFGESRYSRVHETTFRRANRKTPSETVVIRYNDHRGLLAMGVPVDEPCCLHDEAWTRHTADPFPDTPRPYHRHDFATPPAGWRR